MLFYFDEGHKERFINLLNKHGKVYPEYQNAIDVSYGPAYYILTYKPYLYELAIKYINNDRIEFESMYREMKDSFYEYNKVEELMVRVAGNLYDGWFLGGDFATVNPQDLNETLGDDEIRVILSAIGFQKGLVLPFIKSLGRTLLLDDLKKAEGRLNAIDREAVQRFKKVGLTQDEVTRELNVSLSTVRRNWNDIKEETCNETSNEVPTKFGYATQEGKGQLETVEFMGKIIPKEMADRLKGPASYAKILYIESDCELNTWTAYFKIGGLLTMLNYSYSEKSGFRLNVINSPIEILKEVL